MIQESRAAAVAASAWALALASAGPSAWPAIDVARSLSLGAVLVAGAVYYDRGEVTLGTVAAFVLYLASLFEPIARLGIEAQRILYLPNSAEALYRPAPAAGGAPPVAGVPPGFRVMFAGNIGSVSPALTGGGAWPVRC